MNQHYKNQINHDTQQVNYISEGVPYTITLTKNDAGLTSDAVISSATTLKRSVPIDMIIDSISCVCWVENPDDASNNDLIPSTDVRINIRDTMSQEHWIFTSGGSLGQGATIPLNLLFGFFPTQLPAPRPLYQNNLLEVDIEPGSEDIVELTISFIGRRVDSLPPWERQQMCGDPRTSGAYWIYFDPITLTRRDSATLFCAPGDPREQYLRIPTLPYDFLGTSVSGFVTNNANSSIPISRAWFDFLITESNSKNTTADGYTPSYLLGGSTLNSSIAAPSATLPTNFNQASEYIPRSMNLNTAFRFRQQSALLLKARARYSPLDVATYPTMSTQLLFHGMRVPTDEIAAGYPYFNRNDGSQRCPPGSPGIPPGIPQGPQGPYAGYPPQALGSSHIPNLASRERGVYMDNNPGSWPQSEPFPAPILNQQRTIVVRNPMQEGGPVRMPNKNGAKGWGTPGGPMDGRGPRFRNEGRQ